MTTQQKKILSLFYGRSFFPFLNLAIKCTGKNYDEKRRRYIMQCYINSDFYSVSLTGNDL